MRPGRVVALVVGSLLGLIALGVLVVGGALAIGSAIEEDDEGFFDVTLERLASATAAITTEEADLRADPGPPDWFADFVDASVRLQVSSVDEEDVRYVKLDADRRPSGPERRVSLADVPVLIRLPDLTSAATARHATPIQKPLVDDTPVAPPDSAQAGLEEAALGEEAAPGKGRRLVEAVTRPSTGTGPARAP